MKNEQGLPMTWTANGGSSPEISFGGSQNPTHSFPKSFMNVVNTNSDINIIYWGYMYSGRIIILENQFRGSLQNLQRNK